MKQGLKTTEFWMTVATIIGSVAAASQDILDPKYAAIASLVSTAAYTISRALAKRP